MKLSNYDFYFIFCFSILSNDQFSQYIVVVFRRMETFMTLQKRDTHPDLFARVCFSPFSYTYIGLIDHYRL